MDDGCGQGVGSCGRGYAWENKTSTSFSAARLLNHFLLNPWQGGKLEMDVEALAKVVARSGMAFEKT